MLRHFIKWIFPNLHFLDGVIHFFGELSSLVVFELIQENFLGDIFRETIGTSLWISSQLLIPRQRQKRKKVSQLQHYCNEQSKHFLMGLAHISGKKDFKCNNILPCIPHPRHSGHLLQFQATVEDLGLMCLLSCYPVLVSLVHAITKKISQYILKSLINKEADTVSLFPRMAVLGVLIFIVS